MEKNCIECHKSIDDKLYLVKAVLNSHKGDLYTKRATFLCKDTYKKIEDNLKSTYSGNIGFAVSDNITGYLFLDYETAQKKLPNSLNKLLGKAIWITDSEKEIKNEKDIEKIKKTYDEALIKMYAY